VPPSPLPLLLCEALFRINKTDTLEDCRDELEEVLEEWIFLRIARGLPLPVIDGIFPTLIGET